MILIFVACGLIVLGMFGVSLYWARSLPADARIPVRGRFELPKWPGLLVWPVTGAIFYWVFVATAGTRTKGSHQQSPALVILLFVVLALAQFLSIRRAKSPGREWGVPDVDDEADGSSNRTPDVPDV